VTLCRTAIESMCGTISVRYERVNRESCWEVILSCKPLVHTQTVVFSLIGLSDRSLIELCRKQTVVSGVGTFVFLFVCFF
jgi:hypothetical protein